MRSRSAYSFAVLFSVGLLAQTAFSGGTGFTPGFGSRTLARNGLYLAGSDGLTTAIVNPAGIVYLQGRALEFSIIDRLAQQDYDSPTRGLFRSFRENNYSLGGGAYWTFSPQFAAALTFYQPADYQVNWPFAMVRTKGTSPTLMAFDMYNRIQLEAIAPALAFRFGNVALGIAVNGYRVRQHTAFPLANEEWYQGRGLAAYQFEYKQDALAYGFSLGIMATPSDKLRLGSMLRSGFSATLEGQASSQMLADLDGAATRVDLAGDFEMPWSFGAGVSYKLSESWEMNLDAAYSLWGNTPNSFDFAFSDNKWQVRLAKLDTVTGIRGNSFPLAFGNTIDAGLGLEYSPPQGLIYRAGYRYSQSPNASGTYSMFFPGVDQHWFSFGIGYKKEHYSIDASLAYAFGVSQKLTRAENPNSPGRYDSNAVVPAVNLQYSF